MNVKSTRTTQEQQQLALLIGKCSGEAEPEKLYNHLMALKTYLLVSMIQQNTLAYQIRDGQIVEGRIEDTLIEKCLRCTGENKKIMQKLHRLLRHYENGGTNSMEFRVNAHQIVHKLEKCMGRFNNIIDNLDRS
ncbi:MAG: hypothetical protein HQL69_07330 [Magnetococcales bacterium]|nr:hypothetical protein [Magnetococcales bacterium]